MPDVFFIIGGQRCGTTALYRALDQHPDIEMAKPARPEPRFFMKDPLPPDPAAVFEQSFFRKRNVLWRGEKSTSYIEDPASAQRMLQVYPTCRIIAVLRDPVQRAFSNYCFSLSNGLEHLPFEQALDAEEARLASADNRGCSVSPFAYVARGRYVRYLDAYTQVVPLSQCLFITFESLVSDGQMSRVLEFLNLPAGDQDFEPVFKQANTIEMPDKPVMSEQSINRLRNIFRASNQELAAKYHLDISTWT